MARNGQKAEGRRQRAKGERRCTAYRLPPTAYWNRGFTLIEMLVTVVLMGILAAMAFPLYRKTMERGYWKEAGDLLMTIYHGERVYFLKNGFYYNVVETGGMAQWRIIFMDDPNLGSIPVNFKVDTPTSATLTGSATRVGGPCNTQQRTIDQNRSLTPSECWPGCGC